MSSSRGNGRGLNSDDQSNKVTSDHSETVSLPVSLSVPCEDVGTDEKLLDMNNKKLLEEITQAYQIHLADIKVENQQLREEVLQQTMKNNVALAKQSELYDKLILGTSKSISANCISANSPNTNVKLDRKRLLELEETQKLDRKRCRNCIPKKIDPLMD